MPSPVGNSVVRRASSLEGGEEAPLQTSPLQLRAELEEFFDRLSLFAAQENAIVPFDVQFEMLVAQYSTQAIQQAILLTSIDDNPNSSSYTGRLPIHLACDKCAPIRVIRWLIDQDVHKDSIRTADRWGDLPIHTACSRIDYVDVIAMLIQADPDTIFTRDFSGMLPLHMACRYNLPATAISLLLEPDHEMKTLFTRGINEQLPLHIAARCDAPLSVMKILLENDHTHTSVLARDSAGRIPLHVAFLRNHTTAVIDLLLQHMFVGRLERLGLDGWKQVMEKFVTYMSTHERDFMTREKLDVIIEAIQEMKERIVLLEMAVWRESCLSIDDSLRLSSMECLADHLGNSDVVVADYKHEKRIMSGAETIARCVLPFLEGEPLEKYKKEFPEAPANNQPTQR